MSQTAVQLRFEDLLSRIRQPARLIGQETGAGPGFTMRADEYRVVLGFPDAYEIGISNQAMQILYHLARQVEGVAVERTYLPWMDAIGEMRREGLPLLTVETWTPVAKADLVGFTLQHELNYTNVLEMLDLAGVPLCASERVEGHPLVLAGGPAVANFLPMSRFLDAVAVGDGEELFPEVLETMVSSKRRGASRAEYKHELSLIPGVYVPGISRTVARRVLPLLRGAPYPEFCLAPLTAGVHDRAWVEIMRGCTRGCRFCQAGMWYRPVRERLPEEVLVMAEAQLAANGHEELAFASLSTTDYSRVEQLLAETVRAHSDVRVSLPSLRVDSAAVQLANLASPTGPSLTFAPEAGSQRMRDLVNKNVCEADILAAAGEAFRSGRTTLKLYFMIGLPLETDADVGAIVDLCLALRDLGRSMLGSKAGRLQLNVSVNNFVPKAFTPFQWAGMADRETLARRQGFLRARLRRPGIRLALHDVDKSYLEAALARGGEDMGVVIERAWAEGARFDSWSEQYRGQAWAEAFALAGSSADRLATADISLDAPLPWDVIEGVVEPFFLRSEWERAHRGECTSDCRWGECSDCGVCSAGLGNDLAEAHLGRSGAGSMRGTGSMGGAASVGVGPAITAATATAAAPQTGGSRFVVTLSVGGRARFIGHLDRVEIMRRSVRRAGGRLALSAGMRPKPQLSLALPLAVGVEGERELCEFELKEAPSAEFFTRLSDSLPTGMHAVAMEPYEGRRALASRVIGAAYRVEVGDRDHAGSAPAGLERALMEAAERFGALTEMAVSDEREGRRRRIDVKTFVSQVRFEIDKNGGHWLLFDVAVTPAGTARPEQVVRALAELAGVELAVKRIVRTRIELL